MSDQITKFVKNTVDTYRLPINLVSVKRPATFLSRGIAVYMPDDDMVTCYLTPVVGLVSAGDPKIGLLAGWVTSERPMIAYNEILTSVGKVYSLWDDGRVGELPCYYTVSYEGWGYLFVAPFAVYLCSLSVSSGRALAYSFFLRQGKIHLSVCVDDKVVRKELCTATSGDPIISPKEWFDFTNWLAPTLFYKSI